MSTFCKDTFEEKNSTELETIEWGRFVVSGSKQQKYKKSSFYR